MTNRASVGGERTSCSQTTTSHETRNDSIPCILLLSPSLDSTVKRGEHTTPDAEVATRDGRTGLDGGDGTDESLALRDTYKRRQQCGYVRRW